MKSLFISDIHGNINELKKLNLNKYDEIICLGDIYPYSFDFEKNDEVENYLMQYKNKLICLQGNCDYTNELLFTPTNYIKFSYDNIKIACTHGNQFNSRHPIPFEKCDVLIYGHEHYPHTEKINNTYYICVGSIGNPRNGSSYSYMEYENYTFTIYDTNKNIIEKIELKKPII